MSDVLASLKADVAAVKAASDSAVVTLKLLSKRVADLASQTVVTPEEIAALDAQVKEATKALVTEVAADTPPVVVAEPVVPTVQPVLRPDAPPVAPPVAPVVDVVPEPVVATVATPAP